MVAMVVMFVASVACGTSGSPTPTSTAAVPSPTASASPTATADSVPSATAAVPTASPGQPEYGGTLRFPLSFSIDAPDPAYSILTGTRRILYLVYNGIVEQTPEGVFGGDLAERWDVSSDGKAVTFFLREGVTFHDGTPFNAQAVKWNYDRLMDPSVLAPRRKELSPPLERVEAVDDSTVRFHLVSPFRPLLAALTLQAGLIASPAAIEGYDSYASRQGEFGRNPVGTGPFIFKEWVPGNRFSFERNPDYWEEGLPYLEAIETPIIGDKQIQLAMLRTGDLEVMEELRPDDIEIISRNPRLKIVEQEGTSTTMIFFKLGAEPWNNRPLRQAFGHAVDREVFGEVMFRGRATPAQTAIGPSMGQWYDPTIDVYDYSPEKARAKLAEAGYPDGFTFQAVCASAGTEAQECEVLQPILASSGITMQIQTWEVVNYYTDFLAGKHVGPLVSYWSPRPDPGILIRLLYHSEGSQNNWDYSNSEVDRLIEEADTVYDIPRARQIYHDALTMIAQDSPTVAMASFNVFYGMRERVRNFAPVPDRVPRLRDLWLSR